MSENKSIFSVGDIVEVTISGQTKWAKVLELGALSLYGSQYKEIRVEFVEDQSSMYVSEYQCVKRTKEDLIKNRCPICSTPWHRSHGIIEVFESCIKCSKTKEQVVKELWGTGEN